MIEISNANDKPVQRFLGYFLRSVEKSAKLAKVYMRMFVDCSLRARHQPFFFFLCHISLLGDVWTQATVIIWWLGKRELETKARFKRRAIAVRQSIYYKVLKLSKICDKTRNLECPAFLELWKFWVNIWFFEQIFWRKQSLSTPFLKRKHRIVKTR